MVKAPAALTSFLVIWSTTLECTAGLVTETSASNKPSFSFACSFSAGGGGSASFCSGQDKTFAQMESVDVYYRDYSTKADGCLDPERDYVIGQLSDWFNYECKLPAEERKGDSFRLPIPLLQEGLIQYCGVAQPNIIKVVVNYECVKSLGDVTRAPTVKPRTIGPSVSTRSPRPQDQGSTGVASDDKATTLNPTDTETGRRLDYGKIK